jgi:hypothetical protein
MGNQIEQTDNKAHKAEHAGLTKPGEHLQFHDVINENSASNNHDFYNNKQALNTSNDAINGALHRLMNSGSIELAGHHDLRPTEQGKLPGKQGEPYQPAPTFPHDEPAKFAAGAVNDSAARGRGFGEIGGGFESSTSENNPKNPEAANKERTYSIKEIQEAEEKYFPFEGSKYRRPTAHQIAEFLRKSEGMSEKQKQDLARKMQKEWNE